jgi:sterol desaturase/sphingolipid hydroxylase (fatty acid hydroxylase superfamily)
MDKTNDTKIINTKESPPFFKNLYLNSLTKSTIILVSVIYIPVIVYFLYQSFNRFSVMNVLGYVILGVLIWTLAEYIIHRFIFHFIFTNQTIKKIHSLFHLLHHVYIHDTKKYPTLLIASIPGGLLFYYAFTVLFGEYVNPIFGGFVLGYILYEYVHYSTHCFPMNTTLGKILKQHHMRHHYFNYEKNFGVTSPLWDYIFRSMLHEVNYSERKVIK